MKKGGNPAKRRKEGRLEVVSAVKGLVAFMHCEDSGKLVARGSKRGGRKLNQLCHARRRGRYGQGADGYGYGDRDQSMDR